MLATLVFAASVSAAVEAHGGDRLKELESLVLEWRGEHVLVGESRAPGPPWDRSSAWLGFALEPGQRLAERRLGSGGGYYSAVTVLSNPERLRSYSERTVSRRESTATIADRLPALWQFATPLLALELESRDPDVALQDGNCGQTPTRWMTAELDGEPYRIHFDAGSLIVCLEFAYTDYDGTRVELTHEYSDYRERDGLMLPHTRSTRASGDLRQQYHLQHVAADVEIDAYFEEPNGFADAPPAPPGFRDFRVEELAPGTWFVGGGNMFQLFVEFDDFIVALDGASGEVDRRIAALRERVPDKPFRYVLASHHHADHLHGLDEFAGLGATILAAPGHVELIRAQPGLQNAAIEVVASEHPISDGGRTLVIAAIGPVPHSEEMLAAWLPRERILFAADLFVLGHLPAGIAHDNALALHDRIRERRWDVERLVDPHSPRVAEFETLAAAVAARRRGEREQVTAGGPWRSPDD